jgi:hypothetical protein
MLRIDMKSILATILILIGPMSAWAEMHFKAEIWRTLQRYEVRALSKDLDSRIGQLVEVHFAFRGKPVHAFKPNWYESSIWQTDPLGKRGFSNVRVMVSKQDLQDFQSLPTDASSAVDLVVYGKVLRDIDNRFVFVRLIGRRTTVDPAGNVTVSW